MKILHLCASDIVGGAARSAYRLHFGLNKVGIDSEMLVLHRASDDRQVREHLASQQLKARIGRKMWRMWQGPYASSFRPLGSRSLEIFSTDRSVFGTSVLNAIETADVVHLHWVAGMFDFSGVSTLASRKPVVWTLHDMNPFTGGCHFDEGCGRFASECGRCPQLDSQVAKDVSAKVLRRKCSTTSKIASDRLRIVAPSRWLTEQASKSAVLGRFNAMTIPYGLDTEVFQPRDRSVVRQLVDVPSDAKVVLFLADGLSNRRKGFDLLIDALRKLGGIANTYLVAVGAGLAPSDQGLTLPLRVISSVKDDRFLSFIYSTADVFVMSSRADNLPNTVLESIACGTPVVGFDVGGVPDMVIHESTGLLAGPGDTDALSDAVRRVLTDEQLHRTMAKNARQRALTNHTLEHQAYAYSKLYSDILATRGCCRT